MKYISNNSDIFDHVAEPNANKTLQGQMTDLNTNRLLKVK